MVWDRFNNALVRDALSWDCLDLRFAVTKDYPNVFTQVGIVDVVGPIPNDCVAFVSDFPADLKAQIVAALQQHIATPEGLAIWNNKKFYQWSAMAPITDEYYDLVRINLGYPVPVR
jgi:ABC-type phosphate/phosphonate transport system substrate-binding protein